MCENEVAQLPVVRHQRLLTLEIRLRRVVMHTEEKAKGIDPDGTGVGLLRVEPVVTLGS